MTTKKSTNKYILKQMNNVLRVYLVTNLKPKNMKEEQRQRMKQKFSDAGEHSALNKHAVSGSLLAEIKSLVEQYRDEEMPDWNTPYHYDAEGWAAMKYFIQWLERNSNDR